MKLHEFIKKLQNLPDLQKKIILFAVVGVAAVIMGYFLVKSTARNIGKIAESAKSMDLPDLNLQSDEVSKLPSVSDIINSPEGQAIAEALQNADDSQLDTADWKTYANADYGFEIQYPGEWMVQENTKSLEYSLIFCLDNENGCTGKRMNEENKNEDGPIYLFTSKKGNEKPSNLSNHYLGTDSKGTDYYLFNEFSKNEFLSNEMISTFKFTNTTN